MILNESWDGSAVSDLYLVAMQEWKQKQKKFLSAITEVADTVRWFPLLAKAGWKTLILVF